MTGSVRVGVVGTSWFADGLHLPFLKSHPQVELVAICGRNRQRAEEVAAKHAIPQVYTDYVEMFAHTKLDAAVIITPDDQHYAMTMQALDAGLHVLCEKPLALTADQAYAMYVRAKAVGVRHMTYFTYRWMPHYRHVHELIEQGYLGHPYHCNLRYLGGYGRGLAYSWRFDRRRSNGVMNDIGSHMIDMARWQFGEITRVSAHLGTFVQRPGLNGEPLDPAHDSAVLILEFANGAQGVIQVSAVAHVAERGQEQHIELHGELGTLETYSEVFQSAADPRGAKHGEEHFQSLPVPDSLWGDADQEMPYINRLFRYFCTQSVGDRAFIDAILGDRPATPSFYDGWKAQQVIEAALESHATGRWVAIG